jgi:hypothetical protein
MADTLNELKNRMSSLSNGKLLEIVGVAAKDYTAEALVAAKAEIDKRGGIEKVKLTRSEPLIIKKSRPVVPSASTAVFFLKVFAWSDFILSTIAVLFIIRLFSAQIKANPIYLVTIIAFFLQGVMVCVFLLVVASIAEDLSAIRRNTAT